MGATKQDYIDIAEQFSIVRGEALTHREKTLLTKLASRLASGFRRRNQSFDTDRFLQACRAYEEGE